MSSLTPRGRALRWLSDHRGLTEQPAGSNRDNRADGITAAQKRCANGGTWLVGQPWCGVWAWNACCYAGGVKGNSRWASVAFIEDDAKMRRNGFRGWKPKGAGVKGVLRGDLVVLFGRGVHVEVVREIKPLRPWRPYRVIVTDGGNTSSGNSGSQDNGGGAYRRERRMRDVHGFALCDYPEA